MEDKTAPQESSVPEDRAHLYETEFWASLYGSIFNHA